nr:hypothetical protein [Roseovarius lutimaris]
MPALLENPARCRQPPRPSRHLSAL